MNLETAYERYHARLVVYCAKYLSDWHNAEDAAMGVWEGLLKQPAIDYGPAFEFWLFRVARNRCIDISRAQRRRSELPLFEHDRITRIEGAIVARIAAQQRLTPIWAALPPKYRRVLWLRFVEDRALADVAKQEGATVGAIKALQHRAIAAAQEAAC